jgi:chemosensory pili system protein ChpA (sensor histidine kinase/response regulator)
VTTEASNDSAALNWVREDLDRCLDTVRDNLEAFAEDPSRREALVAVQEELERLNLTFLTMQQRGAGILTDEMIAVGGHLLHNGSEQYTDSLNALTDALIVLPSYLDRLQAGHEDLPILLLPTLNELRAAHDETLLSEGTLFAPDLDVIVPELSGSEADAIAANEFASFSRRIRSLYQGALLGWLKEQSRDSLLEPMQRVCRTLYTRLGRNELRRLWWIADKAMQGLRDGSVDNDLALRRLFARLDLTLKAMTEGGERGPASDTVTALSRALLFYAAQARPGSKATDLLRERFRLEELIPDRDALLRARGAVTGRDANLFHSIGEAVREELGQVKDTLDMELRTGRVDAEQREASRTSLQQLADTLEMLNLPVPAKAVQELLPALADTAGGFNMDLDSPLLSLAQKLLEVESVLDTHIRLLGEPVEDAAAAGTNMLQEIEQQRILSRLLDECITTLHEVQEAVRRRLDGDGDADYATPLQQIAGALGVASQGNVAELTHKLARALDAALATSDDAEQDLSNLEPLTDAVAALELYLAGCRDEQAGSPRYLEVMAGRLEGLPGASAEGVAITAEPASPAPASDTAPEVEDIQTPAETTAEDGTAIDATMLNIFLEEFDSVHARIEESLAAWLEDSGDDKALAEVRRGFHTLKGSGRMVGAGEVGDFGWSMEELLNRVIAGEVEFCESLATTLELAVSALPGLRGRMLGGPGGLDESAFKALMSFARELRDGARPEPDRIRSAVSIPATAASEQPAEPAGPDEQAPPASEQASPDTGQAAGDIDPSLRLLMVGEIRTYLSDLEALVERLPKEAPQPVDADLVRAVHTLAGTLSMAPLGQEVEVARELENYFENRLNSDRPVTRVALPSLQACLQRFRQRLAVLEDGTASYRPPDDEPLVAALAGLPAAEDTAAESEAREQLERESAAIGEPAETEQPEPPADSAPPPREPAPASEAGDGGILSIFLEEAVEVLGRCDNLLNTWRDKLSDRRLVQNLQREIHTFKGGARMAGLEELGEFCHAMETLLERIADGRADATVAAVQALEEGCDNLNLIVEALQGGRLPDARGARTRFDRKVKALRLPSSAPHDEADAVPLAGETAPTAEAGDQAQPPASVSGERAPAEIPEAAAKPESRKPGLQLDSVREVREIEDRPAEAEDAAPGAQIRVAAELMDKLVNYAGEVSIYRSRLEQQMGAVRFNLKEVDITVQRLKEQLRKMDIESEAQMMSRYQSASTRGSTEFDPLELDRFSNMQQLSRALAESVSDLVNLHDMLEDSVRQAETLLTQQSRVSSDLQEGLMQTRMTPFGSAAPRLRRVVRAAAAETGKKARLQLRMAGSSDQLDRNVLERITVPLEHMLRNAVAHGIESPRRRRKLGKSEEGEICVTVEAEATEFVIRVQDDGAGIDVDAVQQRAVERGLIAPGEDVEPQRLLQFIRESGFSTATAVTGLAGRGVGMDVVNSEIKQIGGSMEIETERGRGTRFTIRIPFSLAVMQAIGVNVGDRIFQVPLNSVAGVARMSPGEYSALLNDDSPSYRFAGEDYPLLELEPLLEAPSPPLASENVTLLMIRSGEHRAAFRVAGLQGHREVVVKPVGPQISSIPGILGGTIAADGQVMIILDMGPLIRRGLERAERPPEPIAAVQEEARPPVVMVVDDSITMRKVTARVLENHALEVLTAQDGIDAIEKLRDRIPDLMLLDIEMPRMDGYELLDHVRADARLRHIPVVMITSRAGQKHRRKARKAGANAYLTKPYQELELIEQVGDMLDIELVPGRLD